MTGPVAWIRFCGDGCVEGPILDSVIEEVQRKSGAWTPLYAAPQPAPAIDLEQFRDSVEAEFELACADQLCELITYSRHEELKAKHDRLLALIDGQAGPDMIGDALSAMGSTYPLTGAGMRAALDGEQPAKGEGVAGG